MKGTTIKMLTALAIVWAVFFSTVNLFAQAKKIIELTKEDKEVVEMLRKDGATEESINMWILERKLIYTNPAKPTPFSQVNKGKSPVTNATGFCGDLGAEGGWSVWQASTGTYTTPPIGAGNSNVGVITWNATNIA